jgi:peptidoglycan/LPS O-acetylase OafA/YrhL
VTSVVPGGTDQGDAGNRVEPDRTGPVRGYLDQIDIVRLLTFGSVIAVHVIAEITAQDDRTARGTLMLLHFTRETFFVITGFVLFHSSYRRDLDLPRFWRRRYLLVGVPYLAWSLIYFVWHGLRDQNGALQDGAGRAFHDLWFQLVTGTAEYHLYFLIVSMQVYLVFGLLVLLVRATTGHHGRLIAAAAAFQLLLFWFLHDALPSWYSAPHWIGVLYQYDQQLLPSYLLYVLVGALAAVHVERTQAWVLRHGRAIAVAIGAGALLTEGAYQWQVVTGTPPFRASDVLQPIMIPWTLIVTAGLLALGLGYAVRGIAERGRGRAPSRARRAVRELSRVSFGVFLVHPLVISLLLLDPVGALLARPGQPWRTVLLWVATVLISTAFALVAVRTPLSLPLTGRRFAQHTVGRRSGSPRTTVGTDQGTPGTEKAPKAAAGPPTTGRSTT